MVDHLNLSGSQQFTDNLANSTKAQHQSSSNDSSLIKLSSGEPRARQSFITNRAMYKGKNDDNPFRSLEMKMPKQDKESPLVRIQRGAQHGTEHLKPLMNQLNNDRLSFADMDSLLAHPLLYKSKEALIATIEDLKKQLEFRSQMQSMVIHDQRSPATSIKLTTEIMLEKVEKVAKKSSTFIKLHNKSIEASVKDLNLRMKESSDEREDCSSSESSVSFKIDDAESVN